MTLAVAFLAGHVSCVSPCVLPVLPVFAGYVVGGSGQAASARVPIGRAVGFLAGFLGVFVVQLLIYGFHELTEANIFPYSEPLHWATEPYGPDGVYGQYLTYMLIAVPVGWLLVALFFGNGKAASSRVAHVGGGPHIHGVER